MKHVILHLSDLHFGPPFEPRVGEAALAFANRHKPDVVVISGDFTQRARPEQFAGARDFIARLGEAAPHVITTPGNHDVPLYRIHERLLAPYALYREYIHPELDRFVVLPGVALASLNSTRPYSRVKGGAISDGQIASARTFFDSAPAGALKLITFHHHVYPVPSFERQDHIPNAKAILDALTGMHVDLLLTGHIHRGYVGNSLDVFGGKDRSHGVLVVSCGTTTSRRGRGPEREKNSLNLLRVDGANIFVEHHMYFREDDAFMPLSEHSFRRGKPFPAGGAPSR